MTIAAALLYVAMCALIVSLAALLHYAMGGRESPLLSVAVVFVGVTVGILSADACFG